ncbi:MAG: hypothetical protein LCH54_12690 [Bacteroidetes bacterium]|nr:hypothetical protein [Bacteroidota bacterium]
MNSKILLPILFTGFLFTFLSCQEPEEKDNRSLTLSVIESDLTSATLSLQTQELQLPAFLQLTRNGEPVQSFSLHQADTTLSETGLNPALTYSWQVLLKSGEKTVKTSNVASGKTMDTTSHNFIWTVETIGYANSNLTCGVIINENDMWVGGTIYPDSASYKDGVKFGFSHWDGVKWTPEIVAARWSPDNPDIKGPVRVSGMTSVENGTVFAVAGINLVARENNKWVEKTFVSKLIDPSWSKGMDNLWGNSSSDLYLYGVNGGLYHYDGNTLTLIPTNTNLDLQDMHGEYNPKTKEFELLALATRSLQKEGNLLLKISGQTVTPLSLTGMDDYSKDELWFFNGSNYWIAGDGLYYKRSLNDTNWLRKTDYPSSNWLVGDINGWKQNDLIITLHDSHLLHFNGSTWKDFKNDLNLAGLAVGEIYIKDDNILIIGQEFSIGTRKGIVIRGKRIR